MTEKKKGAKKRTSRKPASKKAPPKAAPKGKRAAKKAPKRRSMTAQQESDVIIHGELLAKRGRPTAYDADLADRILLALAMGQSLRSVCATDSMPAPSTVVGWAMDDREDAPWAGFSERYARARMIGAEVRIDEIFDIADDATNDFVMTDKGLMVDHEHIKRSALRIDTRKWYASKVLPKFRDKVALEGGDKDKPIQFEVLGYPPASGAAA